MSCPELTVRNLCVMLLLGCLLVVEATSFMAQGEEEAVKDVKEVNLQGGEDKADVAVSADENKESTTELKPGAGISIQLNRGPIHSPEQWQQILKKDKARAQWIAGRLEKANEKTQDEEKTVENPEEKSDVSAKDIHAGTGDV